MKTYRIKQLEWKKPKKTSNHWNARTPFGTYGIDTRFEMYNLSLFPLNDWPMSYNTFEAAKAAAQAHWEERLKQCLEVVE